MFSGAARQAFKRAFRGRGDWSSGRKSRNNSSSGANPEPPQGPKVTKKRGTLFRVLAYTGIGGFGLSAALAVAGLVYYRTNVNSWETVFDGLSRYSRTMWAGAQVTWDYKIGLRGMDEESQEYKLALKETHLRTAKQILRVCLANGGLYIKVGQYIAAQNHLNPKEFGDTLKVLQDRAPYKQFSVIEELFIEEFGAPPSKFFKEFEEVPIAAASIAQVHRAVTTDGQEVAVKLQYPEIRRRFAIDMFTYDTVLQLLATFFPSLDMRWANVEMRSVLEQELDFYNEAKNAEKAFANFKGHPDYYIPKVHWNLTTDRIMTAEFIHGVKITDVNGMKKLNISPKDAISKTLNALAEQVFEIGFLHADPHPGNIFVRPHPAGSRHGAQVVLLDHGLYKQLSDPVRLQFCRLYKALVLHQLDEIEKACKDMGISSWRMFAMAVLMRPLDPNDLFDDDVPLWQRRELLQSKEKLGAYMQKNMHKKRDEMMEMMKNMPRELLLVFRNNNLIRSINHELGVPVNRFTVFARHSIKALEQSGISVGARWRERLNFEWKIFQMDATYWLSGVALTVLKLFGIVRKDASLEGTDDTIVRDDTVEIEAMPFSRNQL